jgi:lipopolysaccharide export LptBFGC system permease protein LptF
VRRLAEALLAFFPFDARSRRAIDQTLLDWAHEVQAAETAIQRAGVSFLSSLALLRTLVFCGAAEAWRVPAAWFVSRLLILMIVPAVLLSWPTYNAFASDLRFPSARAFQAFALLLPNVATFIAPLAFFYFPAWMPRRRNVPVLGVALLATGITLVAAGWVVPAANQRFREVVYTTLSGDTPHWTAHLERGWPEMTLPELVTRDANAAGHLISRLGIIVAAGTFVCVGAVLSKGSRRRRLAAWLVPIAGFFALMGLAELLLNSRVRPTLAAGIAIWTLNAVAVVTATVLRPAAAPDSQPASQAIS